MIKKLISIFLICIIFSCTYNARACYRQKKLLTYSNPSMSQIKLNSKEDNTPKSYNRLKNLDISKLDKSEKNWFFKPNNNGTPSEEPEDVLKLINKYSAYYLGDTSKKVIYLTFDEGYENGYTSKMLDILKSNKVKAAFFVTTPYIKSNPDLIKRMVNEGHLVCNHSEKHPSMADAAKDPARFEREFSVTEDAYKEVTGKEMPHFFRPPMGKYSELSLFYTSKLDYKTIFWSFAYNDWNVKRQPSPEESKKMISRRTHNGAIILLHAVSKTNSEILDSVIKDWKKQGYTLESLDKL
ncbi:delta-lactam-biosynthetic de-N-acetylase [Clostridium luticellarii]|jgi:peptidoglycan-N-acetylmuramic acid deacetylase|uniref:delta-lactam-biosynthetic de-N-acetylase n=1 Tax=Clostridium luticellarii TaxID=1691940 RepID=UPI002356C3E5|nr:delta-lactam-biosynthetic de-N-acetylase [Clostridium luticellarii]MCI1944314.1 delta-lactam-biosynthetic de-N-acetylase [Clostridium luticellarii]MCI1967810.1 delta-lactam-biosynthetic de-N-acetylase [Clostridium luticellarii]MCI1994688.1 delta-lactam-biosynthetic de-N-acetylase [Clostridium luticellarii]MCI2038815.1 delta-lactam-biosynthetic de-N-acetylase [Clostridium luticellarii]